MNDHLSVEAVWDRVEQTMPCEINVSVVVVTYQTGPSLRECLLTLKVDSQADEVIIVDNGSDRPETEWIKRFCEENNKFRLLSGHGNIGFAKGANLGASAATGDRILFLNPDAILRKGAIAALESATQNLPEPWIVGGRVYGLDGKEQKGGRRRLPGLFSSMVTFANLGRLGLSGVNENTRPLPELPVATQAVSGAMMYMSRKGFETLRGFDEIYFLHVEDIDICRRADQMGGCVVFAPRAGALHYGGTSDSSKFFVEWQKAKGFGYYFRKFSQSPMQRGLATLAIPFIASLLFARVVLRAVNSAAGNGS